MEQLGRRERKKAQTRQSLQDAARRLFLAHGFTAVRVNDVAEAADVSGTTLFKHFPSKEALVFDEDTEREAALVAAVRERPADRSIPAALHAFLANRGFLKQDASPEFTRLAALVASTPALREHARRMWLAHEDALVEAIAAEVGAADATVRALARYALEAPALAGRQAEPEEALAAVFELLENGWRSYARVSETSQSR